jgi:hypothetical protein
LGILCQCDRSGKVQKQTADVCEVNEKFNDKKYVRFQVLTAANMKFLSSGLLRV